MALTDSRNNHGLCSAKNSFIIWTSTWALHFSSDIFIFCLPFFVLRIIRLAWKRKIALYVTFGFGIFSIGACVGRFITVLITYPDVPTTTLELWCALDIYTGLIVACLPSLRPYLTLNTGPSQSIPLDAGQQRLRSNFSGLTNSRSILSEVYSREQTNRELS
jgi:hypothetical protein